MILKSINPFDRKLLAEFEEHTSDEVCELMKQTAESFESWKSTDFKIRASLMKNAAGILRKNREVYARTITQEMGKLLRESLAEVEKCAWVCEYFAENAEKQLKDEVIRTDASKSYVKYEPLGTILGIMPWNFPFWQVFRFLAPTLMAGNTALLKHASNVQGCASHIKDIIMDAGFPDPVFSILIIGSDKIEYVIDNVHIKAVTLTGSEHAGSAVASLSGKRIKKSVLELGGSNAFIVFEDANIENAVKESITARFMNCGQSCIAAKRFLIHHSIAKRFTARFKEEVQKLKVGNPMDPEVQLGPLVNQKQAEEIEKQVRESIALGARALMPLKRDRAFFYPLILDQVKPGMPVFDEEVFGPVAPIISFNNDQEAVDLANNTRYGLGVSLYTEDTRRAEKLAAQFSDGAVFINSLVKSDPRLPFGGTKKSGYGRELSSHGIREFVNIKTIYFA
jgi:succinate-semialdehyde dehydrogenase/glutarate-semialdehyde dehydrogenase